VQSEKIKNLKAKRDNAKVKDCLQNIYTAAVNNTNLMPVVLNAVENYCTLGEIADELRKVFGEFK
jgi:methylmalonyl-CoA mutase N-terminal domain/subunit